MKRSEIKENMKSLLPQVTSLVESMGHETDKDTHYGLGVYVEGIKLEFNCSGGHIKLGFGCSENDNDAIASWLEDSYEISRTKGGLVTVFNNPTLANFKEIYDIVIKHDITLEKPQKTRKGKIDFNAEGVFISAAMVIKLAVDRGLPQLVGRGAGLFDSIDNMITVGESINRTEVNSYREHIVPCDFLVREAVEMYRNGSSLTDIAIMFQQNCMIVLITPEEAHLLDSKLGLKIDMPTGWVIGDDPLARLTFAGIKLK